MDEGFAEDEDISGMGFELTDQSIVHKLAHSFCGGVHPMAAWHHPGALSRSVVSEVNEGFAEHAMVVTRRFKAPKIRRRTSMPTLIPDMSRLD